MKPFPSSAMRMARGRQAFTLLEALLALFIFSTAVIALVEAINATARTVLLSRREREVQARLESLLLEATRSPEMLSKMSTTQAEDSTIREGDTTYVTHTAPVELKNKDDQNIPDIVSVSISARWKEGSQDQEVNAQTWVFPRLYMQGYSQRP